MGRTWVAAVAGGVTGAVLSVGAIAVAGGFETRVIERSIDRVASQPVTTEPPLGPAALRASDGVADVAHQVSPAVARVEAITAAGPMTGSGVMFRDDGYLMTDLHLVSGAEEIAVVIAGGTRFEATFVGGDAWTNLAVVKIDGVAEQFTAVTMGSSAGLQVGSPAIAIGRPSGLDPAPSVTAGVISAVGRQVHSPSGVLLHDMIQTDAPVAAGSAGGALVDGTGAVIGMTTAVADDDAGANNAVGFATPIDLARRVADQIVDTGSAHHVWLGIDGADLPSTDARTMGLPGGVVVNGISPGSPAAAAGLEPSEIITAVGGAPVASMPALVAVLRGHRPGDRVDVELVKDDRRRTVDVVLGEKS